MNISKEVYSGPCFEYPSFEREVLLINNTRVVINLSELWLNESGWTFQKNYDSHTDALYSLGLYLKMLKNEAINLVGSVSDKNVRQESSSRLMKDIENRSVFLPDSGEGYMYMNT